MNVIDVSNSAIWTFADCEGAYHYGRVQNLEKRDKAYPPTFGIIAHEYFKRFWSFRLKGNPRRIKDPMECHDVARYLTVRNWRGRVYAEGNVRYIAGDEEDADKWFGLLDILSRTLDRYYLARGRYDAELYRPLFVEHPVHTTISTDRGLRVRNHGIVDLVAENLDTGVLSIWEHKTVVNKPPEPDVRFRDSQTSIYGLQLLHDEGLRAGEIIWNYLLQKDPDGLLDPDCLFNQPTKEYPQGAPSRKQGIDTNWQVWSVRMRERGIDPNDPKFADIKERLLPRELTRFFYREPREPLVNRRFLIGNYINWARHIAERKARWAKGEPVLYNFRNSQCKFCFGYQLCLNRLKGQPLDDTLRNEYIDRPKPEADRVLGREVI